MIVTLKSPEVRLIYNDNLNSGADPIDMKIGYYENGVAKVEPLKNGIYTFKNEGTVLYFWGNNPKGLTKRDEDLSWASHVNFSWSCTTGYISISGSVMGLLNNGTDDTFKIIPNDYCFDSLFDNSNAIANIDRGFYQQ